MHYRAWLSTCLLLCLSFALIGLACAPAPDSQPEAPAPASASPTTPSNLADALTFHASFDHGVDADLALGDASIYTAPAFDQREMSEPGISGPDVSVAEGAGRFGDALQFSRKTAQATFYRAEKNVAYAESGWAGSVSFWLSLDPATDLEPGFCDPVQITDVRYNDAAIWVDFTDKNPRQFRLGVFGNLEVWNPEEIASDDNPFFLDRLIAVDAPPFKRGEWTHVVITFSGLNTEAGGQASLYLNGSPLPKTVTDIDEPFTWELQQAAIRVGVSYVGLFDDLALFNRALTASEVSELYALDGGVGSLHR